MAEGECPRKVSAMTSRVRAIETKPESARTSAASKMASLGREDDRGKTKETVKERRRKRSEEAIDGA